MIKDKRILIIGGTGALGKTLVKRYYDDNDIIVLSRDEHKHYYLQKEYPNVHSIIGDVKDKSSIKNCLLLCSNHLLYATSLPSILSRQVIIFGNVGLVSS